MLFLKYFDKLFLHVLREVFSRKKKTFQKIEKKHSFILYIKTFFLLPFSLDIFAFLWKAVYLFRRNFINIIFVREKKIMFKSLITKCLFCIHKNFLKCMQSFPFSSCFFFFCTQRNWICCFFSVIKSLCFLSNIVWMAKLKFTGKINKTFLFFRLN